MKKIAIYGHSGSQNHGNEAIVRGLHELFPDTHYEIFTFSYSELKDFIEKLRLQKKSCLSGSAEIKNSLTNS